MRAAIKTLGCRLNQADTARIAADLQAAGFSLCAPSEPADAYVINTCTVTGRADAACRRAARSLRRARPGALIALAGCAVQTSDPARLLASTGADIAVGHAGKPTLARRMAEALGALPRGARIPDPGPPVFRTARALLKVQDGCGFMCSYCAVPLARGKPSGRPMEESLSEARLLALAGHREIVVTGANLGCYSDGQRGLVDLLSAMEAMPELARMRLSSIECSTVEREIVSFMAGSAKLCRHIHLPLQSGDDAILRAMNRRYSVAEYTALVSWAVDRVPALGIGTDVITGFPGEDDASFGRTLDAVRALPFSNVHVFPFSPRPGTPAASMPGQVPERVRKQRAAAIEEAASARRTAFAAQFTGRRVRVLVERVDRGGLAAGWSGEYMETRLPAAGVRRGDIVDVAVSSTEGDILHGASAALQSA